MSCYYDYQKSIQIQKLNKISNELPAFCKQFFTGIEQHTQPSTRLKYAYDLKVFFDYIHNTKFPETDITEMPLCILNDISTYEIEDFLSYIKSYTNFEGKAIYNNRAGVKSKLAAIKSMYRYFYSHKAITNNATYNLRIPSIQEKNIIRLNDIQVDEVLNNIENNTVNSYNKGELYIKRDYAVISLLLGTGIRVSECVGIDISDICFIDCYVQIVRKGGNEDIVYFSDEVRDALYEYYMMRVCIDSESSAFFLSNRKTRFSVRSVQGLVSKYTKDIKQVSPHKLRATFGTNLYIATKDIYLVANTLGHSNVDTTKRYYADIPNQQKRLVRNSIRLRKR